MKPTAIYELRLTDEQAQTISRACEFYSRVMMGQFNNIAHETMHKNLSRDDYCYRRGRMDAYLEEARRLAFPELPNPSQSYGVGHDIDADRAWDVYQVVRHAIAWHDHPEGGMMVCFDEPRSTCGAALPEISVVEGSNDK